MNIQEMHEVILVSADVSCTYNPSLKDKSGVAEALPEPLIRHYRHTHTHLIARAAYQWFRHGGGRAEGKGISS